MGFDPHRRAGGRQIARQAEGILQRGDADLIEMAREFLRDPYFPRRAAKELGAGIRVPEQYARAW